MNKKRKRHFFITIGAFSSLFFVIILLLLLFTGNYRIMMNNMPDNRVISFYYRDTLNIDSLFPDFIYKSVSCSNPNLVQEGGLFYFKDPELISTDDINLTLSFKVDNDEIEKLVKVRCWMDNVYTLSETTDFPVYKGSKLKNYINRAKGKISFLGHDTYYSVGDTLFSISNGRLKESVGDLDINNSCISAEDPEYIQFMRGGEYIFFRNNNKVIVLSEDLTKPKTIYDDRRAIRESLYWNDVDKKLVFSMYTPGTERVRHYLLEYDPALESLDTLQVFYTLEEHNTQNLDPYCRHIHLICCDPYTHDMFIAVGDYDGESGIFRSTDGGHTLEKIGQGSQLWRTLSIFFTKDYIFWTNDSESYQYICRIDRSQLDSSPLDDSDITKFPLFNSAIWCHIQLDNGLYVLGSNSEGMLYDDHHRVYGLSIDAHGVPTVYNLLEEKSLPKGPRGIIFHQLFPIASKGNLLYFNDSRLGIRSFKLNKH